MALPQMTIGLARAAAADKANANMRREWRSAWSETDYDIASDELERICAAYGLHDPWARSRAIFG